MKIAILTQYYKPEMGAPQNRLYEMAVGLKKCGADITIITGMPNYPTGKIFKEYRGKWFCKESLDEIDVFRFWLFASNVKRVLPRVLSMLSFSFSVLFSLKYVRKKRFDFIIVESPPLTLGVSGYFLSKTCKSKMIMNISDLWPLSARELGVLTDGVIYRILEKLECFLYKKSVACMGQSQEIVSYVSQHGASQAYLFRNGVTPERFQNISNKKKTNGNLIIVYAGLLGVAQGILEICQKIDFKSLGAEFHIYGAGGEQYLIEEFLMTNSERGIFAIFSFS
ncbi:glycosyltransferase family 4 protein [Bacteroides nordii]|uniref:glycosyltransferase family 4 protein n=1 Tax=Bacteroides nordii TaxID=291645 RepID=UPI0039B49EC1